MLIIYLTVIALIPTVAVAIGLVWALFVFVFEMIPDAVRALLDALPGRPTKTHCGTKSGVYSND